MAKQRIVTFSVSCDYHKAGDPKCKGEPMAIAWVEYVEMQREEVVDTSIVVPEGQTPITHLVPVLNEDKTPKLHLKVMEMLACETIRTPFDKAVQVLVDFDVIAEKDDEGDWEEGKHPVHVPMGDGIIRLKKEKGESAGGNGKAGPMRAEWNRACRAWGLTNGLAKKAGALSDDCMTRYATASGQNPPEWSE